MKIKGYQWIPAAAGIIAVVMGLSAAGDDFSPYYYQRKSLFEKLPDKSGEIIFLGDSITDGCNWAELLENPRIINRGISGDVTKGVIFRLDEVTRSQPEKIFLMIGINDLADGKTAVQVVNNIQIIVKKIIKSTPETQLYLQSLMPVNGDFPYFPEYTSRADDVQKVNARLEKMAETYGITYIDLYSLFCDEEDKLAPAYTNDGLHLTGAGYLLWKSLINKYIK